MSNEITPFEEIRRTNPAGNEFWSSRDFALVLGYADYRNFQAVIESARTACFNPNSEIKVTGDHHAEARKREGWKWKISFLQEFVFLRASAPPRELRLSGSTAANAWTTISLRSPKWSKSAAARSAR